MKLLRCPINGERPLQEFTYGGEVREMPDPKSASDAEWADYVYNRASEPGIRIEWWYHNASGYWFLAERDIVSDTVIRTFEFEGSAILNQESPNA
jgi:sarcosine oxidase subunit delta